MGVTAKSDQTDRILAEIIAATVLRASYPELVLSKHVNYDMDMIGQPATAKAYPRLSDIGAAGTATEGSDIDTVTTAAMGTQLVLTPSEAAVMRFDLTDQLARKRAPGIATVHEALDSQNLAALFSIFAEDVIRQRESCFEALEVLLAALIDDFSTGVGSTGVSFSLANARAAILALTNKETGRQADWGFFLAPAHTDDIVTEIAVAGGGMGGGVWSTDIQSITSSRAGMDPDGLIGALFGIPTFQTATSVLPTVNGGADEPSCLMVRGYGHPEGPRPGALAVLVGNNMHTRFQTDISKRETEIITIWELAGGERADDMGISITADA